MVRFSLVAFQSTTPIHWSSQKYYGLKALGRDSSLSSSTERPKARQMTGYRLKPALPLCGSSSSSSSHTGKLWYGNDPSAGSPTETLLHLLLPLDDQI